MTWWALDRIRRRRADGQGPLDRDVTCRDPRHGTALELLGRIDLALRQHDHRLTSDLADDVARALRVECGRTERLAHQSEGFEAELIAVDGALAEAGVTPGTDRVEALRALTEQRDAARRRLADVRDDRDRLAAQEARIADELRAFGHLVSTDLPNDVGLALAVERSRARIAGVVFDEDLPTSVIETRAACGRHVDGAPCPLPADHQPPCTPITPPTGYRPELDTGSVAQRLADEYDHGVGADRGVTW